MSWLRAIHDYRGEVAGGPNFAYDLCVDQYRPDQLGEVDLSCWKLAFNGAEPVRTKTIDRFAETFARHGFDRNAMYPGYGMAEATLLIAGGRRGAGPIIRHISRSAAMENRTISPALATGDDYYIVGCGRAMIGERIAVVDPETRRRLPADRIGEIWVEGPHIARGYWTGSETSNETFAAQVIGECGGSWLRTGDLGFLDATGEVYLTGRIKDMIIIRGINFYPHDIEAAVQRSHSALRPNCGAAFSVPDKNGTEALVVVQEVERTMRDKITVKEIVGVIRESVTEEFGIAVNDVAIIRPSTLPKTTSGKIQRNRVRELWIAQKLDRLE